jgi:hypothetical protein
MDDFRAVLITATIEMLNLATTEVWDYTPGRWTGLEQDTGKSS